MGKQDLDSVIKKALSHKYELKELIGSGGMAVVYRGVQRTLDREVAIKIVHQNLIHDTEFIERFIKEAKVSASLNHPNIITIHDVDSIGQVNYMTMEYLDGKPLSTIISETGIQPISKTLKMAIPIAQALNFLHKSGFVHRDVKSSNIFLTNEGRPVLTDFGIVYTNESLLSQPGTVLGTPEFMSPEQANGKEVDGRSDLYSLGVILYECLTATMPFRTDNPLTTVFKVINEPPVPPKEINNKIPGWLNSQVLNLLQKDPNKRVQSGRELARNLFNKVDLGDQLFETPAAPSSIPEPKTQRITLPKKEKIRTELENKRIDSENSTSQNKSKVPLIVIGVHSLVVVMTMVYMTLIPSGPEEISGPSVIEKIEYPNSISDEVFTIVDIHPEFPGGITLFGDFVKENLPSESLEGIDKILFEFIVEKNGKISDLNVLSSIDVNVENQLETLAASLPAFSPGILSDERVRVRLVLPVYF